MQREKIIQILSEWNFWFRSRETGIDRKEYVDKAVRIIKCSEVGIVSGVRRSGKSTILLQIAESLIGKGVNPRNILIVNFEDYRWEEYTLDLLSEIWDVYNEDVHEEGKIYLFLDEVHAVEGWERFIRTLYELKEVNIFVTGSSSRLLSEEYAALLSGRYMPLVVYPLSFAEYLRFNEVAPDSKVELTAKKKLILKHLSSYMKAGGFPKYVVTGDDELLSSYFETIILKDVAERYKVKEIANLRKLAVYYLTNIAGRITYNSIKEFLHLPLNSIERYSYYFEEVYLIDFVPCFSYSLKSQEKLPRKVYCVDTGLAEIVGFRFMDNHGKFMENLVFVELKRRFGKEDLFYYMKNDFEVDFVVRAGLVVKQLVQVCYSLENKRTMAREMKALVKASGELKCSDLLIITWDEEGEEVVDGKKVTIVALWKWLLFGF